MERTAEGTRITIQAGDVRMTVDLLSYTKRLAAKERDALERVVDGAWNTLWEQLQDGFVEVVPIVTIGEDGR